MRCYGKLVSFRALIVHGLLTVTACDYGNPTEKSPLTERDSPKDKTPLTPTQVVSGKVDGTAHGATLPGTGTGGPDGSCGSDVTPIYAIQGTGNTSPFSGTSLVTSGIVVGAFQGPTPSLGGFFIQSELSDGDPTTSEGLFVFDRSSALPSKLTIGDRVRVAGIVREFFGLTEIQAVEVHRCGSGQLPPVTPLPLPYDSPTDLEMLEGMLVEAENLTVTSNYDLGRFGELLLSSGGRLFHSKNGQGTTMDANARRRILLDDGFDGRNLEPVAHMSSQSDTLRVGDTLDARQAVLSFSFGAYRLQPVGEGVAFRSRNARPVAPAVTSADLRVGSFNVRNYFVSPDGRGADDPHDRRHQRDKLVRTIIDLNADVLGLTEIENTIDASGSPVALDDLVDAVNSALGAQVYARTGDPANLGDDAIRSALVYKPSRVQAMGLPRSHGDPIHVRPPIAQVFSHGEEVFTVVVSHFKSKSGCPEDPRDDNADRGQGCWSQHRTKEARALLNFVEELQRTSGDDDVILVGDLNAYPEEDPIFALEAGGLVNQMLRIPTAERYSYVYQGEAGLLDYAFTTPSLGVLDAAIWHINADEPRLLGYDGGSAVHRAPGEPFRSSDHDPILIGLELHGGVAD